MQKAAAKKCAAETWVYKFLLTVLCEAMACGVSPATREYCLALLKALDKLPLSVLSWQEAQQAAKLAWRARAALPTQGQKELRAAVEKVYATLHEAESELIEAALIPEDDEERAEDAVEVRRPRLRPVLVCHAL